MAVSVAVVGASGYTGGELLRWLVHHPHVKVEYVASRSSQGKPVAHLQPHLRGVLDQVLEPVDVEAIASRCQVAFLAVPRGAAMELARPLVEAGLKVIDLGADFRFQDPAVYREWYGIEHTDPALAAESVYGLPELFRTSIRHARMIGNPGCYPTATLLALAPLARAGWMELERVVVAAMSGVSGAGREARDMYHLPHATENVQVYGVAGHRHTPEMEQGLAALANRPARVSFTPHLIPMSRGILATCVVEPAGDFDPERLQSLYEEFYRSEPFVQVLGPGELPQTKAVYGSNRCDVAVRWDKRAERIIAMSAIDNLGKGAATQAIQNMNLVMGWEETAGLLWPAVYP